MNNTPSTNPNIAVIGSGVAGLTAAQQLKKLIRNSKVTIFEASERSFGRIKSLKNFADYEVEIGAEEIHGKNNALFDVVIKNGGVPFNYWFLMNKYMEYQGKTYSLDEACDKFPDVKKLFDFFDALTLTDEKLNKSLESDPSCLEYLTKYGFNTGKDNIHLLNCLLGQETGTDLDKLSPKFFHECSKIWQSGDNNYVILNKSYEQIMHLEFKDEIESTKYNCFIKEVITTSTTNKQKKTTLVDRNHNKYFDFDYVVIAIPSPLYKEISFYPSFSTEKQNAIDMIKMDHVGKLIMKFKSKFWEDKLSWLISYGDIPVFWPTGLCKNTNSNLITGMVAGRSCKMLSEKYKKNRDVFINDILKDLGRALNVKEQHNNLNLKDELVDFVWIDWMDEPFIKGGYSYHTINEFDSRKIIFEKHNDCIHFAGEALAPHGHIQSVHGAYESAVIAAKNIADDYSMSSSGSSSSREMNTKF